MQVARYRFCRYGAVWLGYCADQSWYRWDYGEAMLSHICCIRDRLHGGISCWRRDVVRVISLRKVSDNEQAMFRKILHRWLWRSARTAWGVVIESQSWAAKIALWIAQTANIDSSWSRCHHTFQKRGAWLASKDSCGIEEGYWPVDFLLYAQLWFCNQKGNIPGYMRCWACVGWSENPAGIGNKCLALGVKDLVFNLRLRGTQQVQHQTTSAALPARLKIGKNIVMPERCIHCVAEIKSAGEYTKINW